MAIPRHKGNGGWIIDPEVLMEVGHEIEAAGWDTCLEITEIAMLAAERIVMANMVGVENTDTKSEEGE